MCGEECAFSHCERVYEYTIGGCPLPENGEEPKLYVKWVAGTANCGDNCKNLKLNIVDCVTPGYRVYEYEALTCSSTPPRSPKDCVPSGHDEGAAGYEFECDDTDAQGNPLDNDCNKMSNCQEYKCRQTNYCSGACDEDGDGVQNPKLRR